MPRSRGEGGQFVETIPVEAVLELLKDANEPLTATEIADELGITNRSALNKLNELNESNPTVKRKQVGASAVIWFIKHGAVHEQAFEAFAEQLTDEVGEAIEKIILYGSVARGEAHEDSDVDVLIVIEEEKDRKTVREHASRIGIDVMMEYDVVISKMIETSAQMEDRREHSFLKNVQADGMVYA